MIKPELRGIYLSKQRSLSPAERSDKSSSISNLFFASADLDSVKILHCFVPIEKFNEIDTMLIFRRIWDECPHIQTAAPRVVPGSGDMESVLFGPGTDLSLSAWGIPEPTSPETLDAGSIDMILVPTLCFDSRGNRVGYGKGLYDRLLVKCRKGIPKIGLSYFEPVEEIYDVGGHDVRLDHCVTPKDIFHFRQN
ncbi:MAG: 5-formyltetrahydrofolate cyclo-ligase [Pyrinomonadaceae bacterium]